MCLGRKRPRRAYTGVNPHRNNLMLRCSNCKDASAVIVGELTGAAGPRIGGMFIQDEE